MKNDKKPRQRKKSIPHSDLSVKITSFGPSQSALDQLASDLLRLKEVKKQLKKVRYRLLSIVSTEVELELKSGRPTKPPSRFRATIS